MTPILSTRLDMNLQAVQTVVDKYYMGANHQQEDAPLAAFTAESAIPQPSGEFIAAPPSPATVHLGSTAQTGSPTRCKYPTALYPALAWQGNKPPYSVRSRGHLV